MMLLAALLIQDPSLLQIRVTEGDGAAYADGSRATKGISIQVTGETGRPIEGASVSFRLPDDGPSGTFATGGKTEIATTGPEGKASVWGMQWNHNVGALEIRITAVKGQARAGVICSQYLTQVTAAAQRDRPAHISSGSHKWLWVALVTAGAAGAGIAASSLGGKTSVATPTATALQIGTPTIILGHP
jgi:hypothetical protein